MFLEWVSNLTTEATWVLVYFIVVGIVYGFKATMIYIRALIHNVNVTNDILGYTLLLTWWASLVYWVFY